MGEEILIFHARDHLLHQLNATASQVWELCDGEHSLEQMVDALERRFGAPREQLARDCAATVERLKQHGLLAPRA